LVSAAAVVVAAVCVVAFSKRDDPLVTVIALLLAGVLFRGVQRLDKHLIDDAPACEGTPEHRARLSPHANPGWIIGVLTGGLIAALVIARWV
jgi:hypothetical protein